MREEINGVHDYFVNRIVAGDYEIVKNNKYTVEILVGEYTFFIWKGDHPEYMGVHSDTNNTSFMNLSFTDAEKETLHRAFTNSAILLKKDLEELKKREEEIKSELYAIEQV